MPSTLVGSGNTVDFGVYLDDVCRRFKVPGISIAIIRLDQAPEFHNWGTRSEDNAASNEDTLYSICSNSKAFAATALGILLDDFQHGRNVAPLPAGLEPLDWTTKVADLLPEEWHLQDEFANRNANLLDLLSHTTGMPRHDLAYTLTMDIKGVVQALRHLRPIVELRERWKYNNMMFGVASYIVQKYSLQTYTEFVTSRILKPLGMNGSTFSPQEAFDSGNLTQSWAESTGPGQGTRLIPFWIYEWNDSAISVNAGAGGLISSTKDMAQWVTSLMKEGKHPVTEEQIIPASVIETTMLGHTVVEGKPEYPELSAKLYGLGWLRYSYQGHQIVQHSGDAPGYTILTSLLPDDGIGIVTLVNGDGKQDAIKCIHYRIMEDELGLRHIDWPDRLSKQSEAEQRNEPRLASGNVIDTPSLPLTEFVGTYSSPGYVDYFRLCAWPSSTDSESQAVFSAYEACDPTFAGQHQTALYASWRRLWSTHFKLLPDPSGPGRFTMHPVSLYPHGAGKDTSPFLFRFFSVKTTVEFEIVDRKVTGMGLWNEPGEKEPPIGNPRKDAEAWFDKVA
ncbi:beta-lactamase/transpeptidase-like protein [Calocera cornea HHB12733]|uniref:Beta-lactamase/transpeptidase-like protein n=1 Tax=Calocera cornea HHB12733 TaxID=1353952 RepID=A0A165EYQ1_9BASI|nr:beta-lactamase/transpeptidase-like protein [Calocera cornea HHB12733]